MKMRDWESTLVQAWKSRVGGTNVWEALSLPNSLSSMAGLRFFPPRISALSMCTQGENWCDNCPGYLMPYAIFEV